MRPITVPVVDMDAVGPVSEAYRKAWPRGAVIDGKPVGAGAKLISGPQGGAKTTQTFINAFNLGCMMPRSPIDGVRRIKLTSITTDLTDVWDKTLRTWRELFPLELGSFTGSRGRKLSHHLLFRLIDGSILDFQHEFDGFGNDLSDAAIETFFRGLECTVIFLNEMTAMPPAALRYALGRTGRYPHKRHGRKTWYGVMGDFNKPSRAHWLYEVCVEKPWPGVLYFEQPSGLSPQRENRKYIEDGYYEAQAELMGAESDYTKRMIRNEWGVDPSGQPVFPTYDDGRHFSTIALTPQRDSTLIVGTDAGRTPSAVFLQRDDWGQFRVLCELFLDNAGPEAFAEAVNRLLSMRFPQWRPTRIRGWGDPSSDKPTEGSDVSHMRIVSEITGIQFRPAPGGNEWERRRAVVSHVLDDVLADGRPGLLIGCDCPMLRSGFLGGYAYPKLRSGDLVFRDGPPKGRYSHVQDALQNALKGEGVLHDILNRREHRQRLTVPVRAYTDFAVLP